MTEQEKHKIALTRRVHRLDRLVQLNAPKYIIASEFILVMKATSGYCGEAFGNAWQDFMLRTTRASMGMCVYCGAEGPHPQGDICPKCWAEAEVEEGEEDV